MRYSFDHDLHIHSQISSCSNHPEQTTERLLQYAKDNNLSTICLTDHFWDDAVEGASDWYFPQNYDHISKAKPLPQAEGIRFLFGCETELDKFLKVGISKEKLPLFDFIIIPTTHFHMKDYTLFLAEIATPEARAKAWVKRLDAVLDMDLPFHKIGFAHLTCSLLAPTAEEYHGLLTAIPEEEMERLFTKIAQKGAGVELNADDMKFKYGKPENVLKVYRIAKKCGCKFYMGSDAHTPNELNTAKERFERAIDLLDLKEEEKFHIG